MNKTFLYRMSLATILCFTTSIIKSESCVASPKQKAITVLPAKKLHITKKQPSKFRYWTEAFFIKLQQKYIKT